MLSLPMRLTNHTIEANELHQKRKPQSAPALAHTHYIPHLLNSKTECLLQMSSSSGGRRFDAGIPLPYTSSPLDLAALALSPPPSASLPAPPSLGEPSAPRGLRSPPRRVELRRRRPAPAGLDRLVVRCWLSSSLLLAKQHSSLPLPPLQLAAGLVEWSGQFAGRTHDTRRAEYNAVVGGRVWRRSATSPPRAAGRADPAAEAKLRGDKPSLGAQLRRGSFMISPRTAGEAGGAAMNAVGMAKAAAVGVSILFERPKTPKKQPRWCLPKI